MLESKVVRKCFRCSKIVYRGKSKPGLFGLNELELTALSSNQPGGYKNKYCCKDCYRKLTSQS